MKKDLWHSKNAQMVCMVRSYIEGEPLNPYAKNRELTQKEVFTVRLRKNVLIWMNPMSRFPARLTNADQVWHALQGDAVSK